VAGPVSASGPRVWITSTANPAETDDALDARMFSAIRAAGFTPETLLPRRWAEGGTRFTEVPVT
jgi:hypothetical protein